jgi:hypothetical protein
MPARAWKHNAVHPAKMIADAKALPVAGGSRFIYILLTAGRFFDTRIERCATSHLSAGCTAADMRVPMCQCCATDDRQQPYASMHKFLPARTFLYVAIIGWREKNVIDENQFREKFYT